MKDELQALKWQLQHEIADFTCPRTFHEQDARPAVKVALRQMLRGRPDCSVFGDGFETSEGIMSMLDRPQDLRASPELLQIALAAVEVALDKSAAPADPGPDPSHLMPVLKDLAWVYIKGGGKVTRGSNEIATPFVRWAFVFLSCAPKKAGGVTRETINNVVKRNNWDDIPPPAYALG